MAVPPKVCVKTLRFLLTADKCKVCTYVSEPPILFTREFPKISWAWPCHMLLYDN